MARKSSRRGGSTSSRGKSSSKGRSSSRGKSSSGSKSSSKGRSSSKSSAGRSSSSARSSGKKSTASKSRARTSVSSAARSKTTSRTKATKRTTVGKPARKVATVAAKRTTKTVSPLRKIAKRPTTKAKPIARKPIIVKRRVTKTVSPPAKNKLKPTKLERYNPAIHASPRGKLDAQGRIMGGIVATTKGASFGALQQAQAMQSAQTNFNNQILGRQTANTIPVRVNFASGARMMYLGAPAIRAYEAQGLKVTGVSMTLKGGSMYPSPNIPRIRDKTDRWANNPPPLLTVPKRTQAKAPSPRGQNNIFKQNGSNPNSNPWDPLGDLMGMFDNNPQQAPSSQYLPPADVYDYPRPVYDAFANDQGFYQSPQPVPNFNQQIQTDTFDAKAEIGKLLKNKYALYAGIGIAALIGVKIILR